MGTYNQRSENKEGGQILGKRFENPLPHSSTPLRVDESKKLLKKEYSHYS